MAITSPRSSARQAPTPPPLSLEDEAEHRRLLSEAISRLLDGKIDAVGTVTLTANAVSTTLSNSRIGLDTIVFLFPTTANAAAALATTYQTYKNAANEAAVLNHANNAQTDRTFAYALLG